MSNTINKVNNFEIFKKYFTECKTIRSDDIRLDLFYNENDSCFVDSDKGYLFTIGVFIYKNEWNDNALQLFLEDCEKEDGFTELLTKTRGQFCLVMYHKKKFYVITDKAGATPIYCYRSGDTIEISNIFIPLAKNNNISLSYDWIAQYVSGGKQGNMYYYDKTPANEIAVLDCGSVYTVGKDMRETRYYDICSGLKMGKYVDPTEIVNTAEKMLSDNLSFLRNVDKVYCDITGGFDTRTNLAILMHNNTKFNCGNQIPTEYRHQLNTGRYSDLVITKKIADHFNLNIDTYSDTKFNSEREKWREMAYDFFNGEDSWTYSRRAGYYNYVKNENKILIAGLYGTELLAQSHYYRRCGRTRKTLDINSFLHRYYPYCDVMKDNYYPEERYHKNLRNFLESFLEHTDFQNFNDAGTYLQYLTFYRTFFSKYHGAVNAIIPAYSPFAEANFIRFMVQTSFKAKSGYFIERSIISKLNPELGNIETSHGYPATKITVKNFYKFIRILNPWEPNFQYVGPLNRLTTFTIKLVSAMLIRVPKLYNVAHLIYSRIARKERYTEDKPSTGPLVLDQAGLQIDNIFNQMPISQIIDKDKLKKRSRTDYAITGKINTLNRLLSDVGLIE